MTFRELINHLKKMEQAPGYNIHDDTPVNIAPSNWNYKPVWYDPDEGGVYIDLTFKE